MTVLKELCRCLLRTDLSHRQIAQKVDRSPSTVARYSKRLRTLNAQWEQVQPLDEVAFGSRVQFAWRQCPVHLAVLSMCLAVCNQIMPTSGVSGILCGALR